ncbi:unnamed protein product [Penicillium salamii]|nr:unnamed protein product [Penicillium salamii]
MFRLTFGKLVHFLICVVYSAPVLDTRGGLIGEDSHWVNVWTAMPQLVEPANLPPFPFNGSDSVFENTTIRQTLQVSLPARQIRIRLSNAFGTNEVAITGVTVSQPATAEVGLSESQPKSMRTVFFNGKPGTLIPNGALAVSDPIDFAVEAQSPLMISIYLGNGQSGFSITGHPGSRTTSYLTLGNWISAQNTTHSSVQSVDHWYFISGVEGLMPPEYKSVAIIGDSITDGRGSTTNANNRWPDLLLRKMQKHNFTSNISISNQAAGGNRILQDGLGPSVLSRLDRDVLSQSGVRFAIIFEGVNDIGLASPDAPSQSQIEGRLIAAYQQVATRVHAMGIPLFGATITPFGSSPTSDYIQPYSSAVREKTRQHINAFIRESGIFDAVLDFDRVLGDPLAPSQLLKDYDSGDHLHPNVAGYQALADYFPLEILAEN